MGGVQVVRWDGEVKREEINHEEHEGTRRTQRGKRGKCEEEKRFATGTRGEEKQELPRQGRYQAGAW